MKTINSMLIILLTALFFTGCKQDPYEMRNECIKNLRKINGATHQWALDAGKAYGTPVDEEAVNALLEQGVLECPAGGTYTYGAVGESPECSVPGHEL